MMNQIFDPSQFALFGATTVDQPVLYIFEPRMFHNQYHRPMKYTFDNAFMTTALDVVDKSMSSVGQAELATVTSRPEILSAVIPTAAPTATIHLNQMSVYHTFVLYVPRESPRQLGSSSLVAPMSRVQAIYHGYFTSEPVINQNGRLVYDEKCQLVITHKTQINTTGQQGAHYSMMQHSVTGDVDVVNPTLVGQLSSTAMIMGRPWDLYTGVMPGMGDGEWVSRLGQKHVLGNNPNPIGVNTNLTHGPNNIQKTLLAVSTGMRTVEGQAYNGAMGFTGPSDPAIDLRGDVLGTSISTQLQDSPAMTRIGLNEGEVITMASIVARYNPKIEPPRKAISPISSPMDQTMMHPSAQMSALLTHIIPTLATHHGILDTDFIWDTHLQMRNTQPYKVNLVTFPPNFSDAEENKRRYLAFLNQLDREVFPIVRKVHGHFNLHVTFVHGQTAYCRLNYHDDNGVFDTPFETPLIWGGTINPLISDTTTAHDNGREIHSLIMELTGVSQHVPTSLFQDSLVKQTLDQPVTMGPFVGGPNSTTQEPQVPGTSTGFQFF